MNINYKAENKGNEQLNLEKRNKQNSGIPKPVLYTSLSIAGVAAISIIGKILYDNSKKNNDKLNEKQNTQVKSNEASLAVNNQQIYNNVNEIQNEQQNKQLSANQQIMYNSNVNVNVNEIQNEPQINEWEGLVYDRDINIGNTVLSPAFQKWICKYLFFPRQDYPLCWHNASLMFLACPEIRFGEEEYKQEFKEEYPAKIKSMIGFINKCIENYGKNKCKVDDYFNNNSEKVGIDVPRNIREMPDGLENEITNPNPNGYPFLFYTNMFFNNSYERKFNDIQFTERIVNLGLNRNLGCDVQYDPRNASALNDVGIKYEHIDYLIGLVANKNKGFTIAYTHPNLIINLDETLRHPIRSGFYPTYITVSSDGHYYTFLMLYDSSGNIKNYILHDGGKLQIFDANEGYNTLKSKIDWKGLGQPSHNGFFVRYSPQNIVKKYYTPELMFNN